MNGIRSFHELSEINYNDLARRDSARTSEHLSSQIEGSPQRLRYLEIIALFSIKNVLAHNHRVYEDHNLNIEGPV